jgi:outer membrane protein assembly factor BamB
MTFVTTRDSTSSGTIYALDMADGTIVWQYSLPAPVSSSPDVANGVVYFGTEAPDSTMYAINEYTGELRWSMPLGGGGGGGGIISSPAVADNLVFVGTLDGYFYCLNATTGVQVWNWTTAGPIVSSPAVADGRVFFAAGLIMYAREEIFGGSNWTSTLDSPIVSSPAVADGLVFIGTTGGGGGGGRLYALRETDGSTLWCDLESGNVSSSPAVDSLNGWVIVGAGTNVTCVSETSGSPIWPPYVTLGQIGLSSPAIASNGLVYICSHDQHVYCINETTGLQVWNFAVGVASDSSPAICGGHVYLTPGTGVYCFGLPWPDISVLSLLPGPLYASGGFLYAPINCTVKNKGGFDETFSVECYVEGVSSDPQVYEAPSKVVLSQTLTLTPGQQTTTTGVWNVSDSGDPSDNLLWASVNPVVCEVNTNDNYLIYGTIHIGGEPGGGGSERIPYLQ